MIRCSIFFNIWSFCIFFKLFFWDVSVVCGFRHSFFESRGSGWIVASPVPRGHRTSTSWSSQWTRSMRPKLLPSCQTWKSHRNQMGNNARTHTTNAMTTILLKQKWINAQKCYLFAFWEEFLLREQTLVGWFIEVIICWPGIFGIITIRHYKDLYATNQYNGISLFCGNSIRRCWARFPRSLFAGHGVISGDSAVSPRWRYWKLLVLVMAAGIPGWSLGTL